MGKATEWIEDLLGAVKAATDPKATELIRCCGKGCASRKNVEVHMEKLRRSAAHCESRADFVDFLSKAMPVRFEEAEDGILMHLDKTECSCPMSKELTRNTDMLCECTRGHGIATWSAFFGKPVEIEIVESILRGGSDCVIKIHV